MIATDLFGDPVLEPVKHKTGAGGYPAMPGTGPKGKTCHDCENYCRVNGGSRSYPKCLLMKLRWTHGTGTDIKAHSPACRKFEPKSAK